MGSIVKNGELRETTIEYCYGAVKDVEVGSKEFMALVDAISKLETSRREDSRVDQEMILRDREIMINEKKMEKNPVDVVLEVLSVMLPTGAYAWVVGKLIPHAEEKEFVSPSAKNLSPKHFNFLGLKRKK